jgi:methyl-accepting chemotaxis protein
VFNFKKKPVTTFSPSNVENMNLQMNVDAIDGDSIEAFLKGQKSAINSANLKTMSLVRVVNLRLNQTDKIALNCAVLSSIIASEAQASISRAYGEITNSEQETKNMAAAIEELGASVKEISGLANRADSALEEAAENAKTGADHVSKAASSAYDVRESLSRLDVDMENLNAAARDIRTIAGDIDSIASQTNLLALNATIEAARAGEAGKGFAVVAGEVKSLSSQTAGLTENIRSRIKRLEDALGSIIGAVEEAKDSAQKARDISQQASVAVEQVSHQVKDGAEAMASVASILNEQTGVVGELSFGINRASQSAEKSKDFIGETVTLVANSEAKIQKHFEELEQLGSENYVLYRAKADHVLWKKRLAGLLSGLSGLNESELSDHHNCRLGKWWNKFKTEIGGNSPAFLAIEEPHRKVHEYGKLAAMLFNRGEKENAQYAFEDMNTASMEVLRHLDALIAERESAAS